MGCSCGSRLRLLEGGATLRFTQDDTCSCQPFQSRTLGRCKSSWRCRPPGSSSVVKRVKPSNELALALVPALLGAQRCLPPLRDALWTLNAFDLPIVGRGGLACKQVSPLGEFASSGRRDGRNVSVRVGEGRLGEALREGGSDDRALVSCRPYAETISINPSPGARLREDKLLSCCSANVDTYVVELADVERAVLDVAQLLSRHLGRAGADAVVRESASGSSSLERDNSKETNVALLLLLNIVPASVGSQRKQPHRRGRHEQTVSSASRW